MKKTHIYFLIMIIMIMTAGVLLLSKDMIYFPHKPHSDSGFGCTTCHEKVESSTRARNNNYPSKKICTKECHDSSIFKNLTYAKSSPQYRIEFNHEMHIAQDMKCAKCHAGINSDAFEPGKSFPGMPLCFTCHNNSMAAKTCSLCHTGKVPFPHQVHLQKAGLGCDSCHPNVNSGTSNLGGRDIPSRKICNDCHEEKDGYGKVTSFSYSQFYKINHKLHVEEQGLGCKECHAALYEKKTVTQHEAVVKMDYCFQCHDNATATQHCMLCHVNRTVPDDHKNDWDNLHKVKAASNLGECQMCHTSKDFCIKCHKGERESKRYHNLNFIATHRYESRVSLKNCTSCHSSRQCQDCHRAGGNTTTSKVVKNRHPLGWTNRFSPSFHERKARLNLASCRTCHTRNDCYYCHFTKKR